MSKETNSGIQIFSKVANVSDFYDLVKMCLPSQGAIEIQNDSPETEHSWHTHDTDETLVILEGAVRFYYEEHEEICTPGDIIKIPRGIPHGSIASDVGAKYLIAFERIDI